MSLTSQKGLHSFTGSSILLRPIYLLCSPNECLSMFIPPVVPLAKRSKISNEKDSEDAKAGAMTELMMPLANQSNQLKATT